MYRRVSLHLMLFLFLLFFLFSLYVTGVVQNLGRISSFEWSHMERRVASDLNSNRFERGSKDNDKTRT